MRWVLAAMFVVMGCTGTGEGSPGVDASGPTISDASVPADGELESGGSDAVPDAGFSYLTINLWNAYLNGDDWDERRAIVADAISAWAPDAICMQEVVESGSLDNGSELIAGVTGYEAHYVQTHDAFVFQEGIAVLSPWPISNAVTQRLPITDFGVAERTILSVDVAAPDGQVRVFCSHMSIDLDETLKADESVVAWQFMNERRTAEPAFFAGDLNAQPDTPAMRLLRGEATHNGVTGDLVDTWLDTQPNDLGLTHPSDAPEKRIDYVYVVPGTSTVAPGSTLCERVFTDPVNGVYASDHLGLRCAFSD